MSDIWPSCADPVDEFFDKVTVNADDAAASGKTACAYCRASEQP